EAPRRGVQERGERELRGEDQRDEERRRNDDVGAGAVEVRDEHSREELAHGSSRPHRLAFEAHGPEGEGEEGGKGKEQQEEAEGLRPRRLDGPAPEELPPGEAEHEGEEQRGHAEELGDEELGEEGADGPDEVPGERALARLEEGRGVARVERGEA